jgi:hypothetical protein
MDQFIGVFLFDRRQLGRKVERGELANAIAQSQVRREGQHHIFSVFEQFTDFRLIQFFLCE